MSVTVADLREKESELLAEIETVKADTPREGWSESDRLWALWDSIRKIRQAIRMIADYDAMRDTIRANTERSVCVETASGYRHSAAKRDVRRVRPMLASEAVSFLNSVSHALFRGDDGKLYRVKINGAVKTWKRDPSRVEVPVKYGIHARGQFRDTANSDGTMAGLVVDCDRDGDIAAY